MNESINQWTNEHTNKQMMHALTNELMNLKKRQFGQPFSKTGTGNPPNDNGVIILLHLQT